MGAGLPAGTEYRQDRRIRPRHFSRSQRAGRGHSDTLYYAVGKHRERLAGFSVLSASNHERL